MSEITFIKGKDASLEESISKMQSKLEKLGFDIVHASWFHPAEHIFSLHIHDSHCPGLFTNGKGTSRKSTLASALGEYLERLSTNYFFSDYWLAPATAENKWLYFPDEKQFDASSIETCLTPELWELYQSEGSLEFDDFLSFNDCVDQVTAIPLQRQSDQEPVYFPMNLLSNLYASNGLSAGNTHLEAQVQGLSEIFERWVKNKILRENLCLPEVPKEVVERFPVVVEAMESLNEMGIELSIRDASLGGNFPVINVTLFEQKTGTCFASFGAHPIFEVALERTLTESLQGRKLNDLDGFQMPVFDEQVVAENENIENHFIDSSGLIHAKFISNQADYEFVNWDFSGTTEEQWQKLVALVTEQGADVYVANYRHCGFEACRIIVPGMSEIYPFDELAHSNQNDGRYLRQALFDLPDNQDHMGLVELIEQLGLSSHQGVASLIGLMPDSGSFWSKLKVCELRFWALLAAQEHDEALEALYEVQYYVSSTDELFLTYNALKYGLEMRLSNQVDHQSHALLFGSDLSGLAWQAIQGELVYHNQPIGQEIFSSSQQHEALLSVYRNLHQAKEGRLTLI